MDKLWKVLDTERDKVIALQKELKINEVICKILVQRGFDTFDKAREFFRPQLSMLHSPWLMKDMDKAVARILLATERSEKILIYGDYDVDGTTAVATVYQFIKGFYDNVEFYIPNRYREGYGVSRDGIRYANENNFSLIISLDCGIKSVELITLAKSLSIDFIICDHHLPDSILPPAVAILNPKQIDCNYPYKDLCGCGVGFKLVTALAEKLGMGSQTYLCYLDLLATAIAADIVPMTGENRVMAYYGLQQVNNNPCNGIRALMQLANVQKEMFINNLVFVIAPRVNAAGRMDDAKKAVQLFIERDCEKALKYAEMLHSDNTERRTADLAITEEALALIEGSEALQKRKSTVVYREHWHKGVVGIVASRLIESYYKPTIVLTRSGEIASGSARSVAGFNLYEAIHACKEHLLGYGGHFAAAGMTLLPENVDAFMNKFEQVVSQTILPESLVPALVIDAELSFKDLTIPFYNIINQMEPYGPENTRPVFLARNVVDSGSSKIIKEQHVKFCLRQNNSSFKGIGFNMAHRFHLLKEKRPIDIVFTIEEAEWDGQKLLQLKIHDFKPSEVADNQCLN